MWLPLNPHLITFKFDLPGAQFDALIFQTLPIFKTEVLLVDRRGDDGGTFKVTNDAAGDHIGLGEGIKMVEGVKFVILSLSQPWQVKNSHLGGAIGGFNPGGDARKLDKIGLGADLLPRLGGLFRHGIHLFFQCRCGHELPRR